MKKIIASFSIALAMLGISCFAGCCFNSFTADDFIKYVQDENTISNFREGFDIEVQDDSETFLTGRVLSNGKMDLNYYGEKYYVTGDGYVYINNGTKKSKMLKAEFEEDENYDDAANVMNIVKKYFSGLKLTILDDATYYDKCNKKEEDGCQLYILDDYFYDGNFEYRQIYEMKYKDNQIVQYVDAVYGRDTSYYDQTITITATTEDITFPNFDDYYEYIDVTTVDAFVSSDSVDSDMSDFTFAFTWNNGTKDEGEYHQTKDGDLLVYRTYNKDNQLTSEMYVVGDKIYVNHLSSSYDVKQYYFDLDTTESYFTDAFIPNLNRCKGYANNYAAVIRSVLSDSNYEIDQIIRNSNNEKVEIYVESHRTYNNNKAIYKYTYQENKMINVDISYIFSTVSEQNFVATACENKSFEVPTELETYKYVTSYSDLMNA